MMHLLVSFPSSSAFDFGTAGMQRPLLEAAFVLLENEHQGEESTVVYTKCVSHF
jgi:hypothetical protein